VIGLLIWLPLLACPLMHILHARRTRSPREP
jgi:hypothetical protein